MVVTGRRRRGPHGLDLAQGGLRAVGVHGRHEEAGRQLGDAVDVPHGRGQRRSEQSRDRVIAEARDGDVVGDRQPQLGAGRVDAVGDRVRQAQDGARALVAGQELERQRPRAVERVGAGDEPAIQAERRRRGADGALGLAARGALDGPRQHRDAPVAERAQVLEALAHAALVVEDHLAGDAHTRQRIADRHRRDLLGDRLPAAAGRTDGDDHEAVDAVVDQAPRELELAGGLAVGVGHERAAGRLVELALDRPHELLVPEVGQAPDEQAHDGGRPAGQRAGDRVGLVAELRGGLAHAALGRGRHLHPAQRVAHSGRREPRVVRKLADRDAAPRAAGHVRRVLAGAVRRAGLDKGGIMGEAVH
jgi:hypothetical protein